MTSLNTHHDPLSGRGPWLPASPANRADDAGRDGLSAQRLREALRQELSVRLSQRLRVDEQAARAAMTPQQRRSVAEEILADAAEAHAQTELARGAALVSAEDEQRVIDLVLDEVFGFGGLEPLLANPDIENINIIGDRVFVRYADGTREQLPPVVGSDAELVQLIRDLAARCGLEERRFDRGSPIVNFQLPGGERVSAVMAVTDRPAVSIRRHRFQRVTLGDLRARGTLDEALESLLAAMVRARKNIVITGGPSIGKTTMLRALAAEIPSWESLITIEDVFELRLGEDEQAHPEVLAMQAREANIEGHGRVSASDLVWASLRLAPDRVILGEIRGPEVIPMCNAMNMGSDGSMATLHSSTSRGVFTKLANYAVQGPERLMPEATSVILASALHFVVHLAQPRGERSGRVVSSIREVIDADGEQIVSNEIWRPGSDRRAHPAAPLRSDTLEELADAGYDPDLARHGRWT